MDWQAKLGEIGEKETTTTFVEKEVLHKWLVGWS